MSDCKESIGNIQFKRMIALAWGAFAAGAVSALIDQFDVKTYYDVGFLGFFLFQCAFLGLKLWLIRAMMHCENWARKTYIAMTFLSFVSLGLTIIFDNGHSSLSNFFFFIDFALSLACTCYCFSTNVRNKFFAISGGKQKSSFNLIRGTVWWICFVAAFGILGFVANAHEGSEEWTKDVRAAATAGPLEELRWRFKNKEQLEQFEKSRKAEKINLILKNIKFLLFLGIVIAPFLKKRFSGKKE